MNIKEVHALSHNLWEFYLGRTYTYLFIQIGGHAWFLSEGKITGSTYLYTHWEFSVNLFDWVIYEDK